MKLRVRLFDGTITLAQQLITLLWAGLLIAVVLIWSTTSLPLLGNGLSSTLLSMGHLLGLLATFAALTQFMLMGRIAWIERAFGLDRLASFHRLNGYVAIISMLLHAVVIVASYSVASGRNYFAEYLNVVFTYEDVKQAVIAQVLFIAVIVSSIYIARRRLSFENWYYVHLSAYAAIVLASLHQFTIGTSFLSSATARYFWLGLYVFVAANLLIWRFGLPIFRFMKYDFKIAKIEPETPTVTSVYISAKSLSRLKILPGQFVLVRILTKDLWRQEHPFTVSYVAKNNQLRLSIRAVGDYTNEIAALQAGSRVVISGPFGRFTSDVMTTDKQLLIAGGIGITPIRALAEQSAGDDTDAVVLYSNRDITDVPLRAELDEIAQGSSVSVQYIYSDAAPSASYTIGRIDKQYIVDNVPDVHERDIYVCGPPAMMSAIVAILHELGVAHEQIHYEVFSLHP